MIEAGIKDFVVDTWLGFGAPAGLPQPLVTRLNAEFNRITDLPEMRKKFVEQGISAWPPRTPEQALKFLHEDRTSGCPSSRPRERRRTRLPKPPRDAYLPRHGIQSRRRRRDRQCRARNVADPGRERLPGR